MKRILWTIAILILPFGFIIGQRIKTNVYIDDVDEPFQFNKNLKNHNYHIVNLYRCTGSIFDKNKCKCTRQESYNDSGRIVKLKTGSDVKNGKLNLTVNYITTTDSICTILTEYEANYIDSLSLFKYWDTVVRKTQNIYEREKNGNVIVKSTLIYETKVSGADTILRYDKADKLQEIYYPGGNRKKVREWTDSSKLNESKIITRHTIFPEEEKFDSYEIMSKNGLTLETGFANTINDSLIWSQKVFYIYDKNGNLIYKNTVAGKNQFIQSETYEYTGTHLDKHILYRNANNTVDNKHWLYDKIGRLTELYERDKSNPERTWKNIYIYSADLQSKSINFQNGHCIGSTYFFYE